MFQRHGIFTLVITVYRDDYRFSRFDAQTHDRHQFFGLGRFAAVTSGDDDGAVQGFSELRQQPGGAGVNAYGIGDGIGELLQQSSSTPHFADTTTTPVGKVVPGKPQQKKNLTKIMVAHGIPYVAQTTFIGNFKDITEKSHKAIYTPGAAFLNVMAPCPRGWRYPSEKMMEITKLAVETCVWPLYEVVEGKYILSYKPKKKLPV